MLDRATNTIHDNRENYNVLNIERRYLRKQFKKYNVFYTNMKY